VAIYEAVAALMESTIVDYDVAGVLRCRTGSVLPGVAPSNIYLCADGSEIVIAANADAVFRRLCSAIGRPELADDPRYRDHASRGENMVELDGEIEAWSRSRGPEEALEALERFGVPAGKVFSARDMLADPHYAAREMILRPLVDGAGSTISMAGIVPKYSRTPGAVRTTGPRLGEHTREVLERYAGVGEGEWNELLELGLVEAPPQPAPRALAGEGSR
jgi:formyl-CoA transferase/succinyl-CoA--D-citramalate CoA-transferase